MVSQNRKLAKRCSNLGEHIYPGQDLCGFVIHQITSKDKQVWLRLHIVSCLNDIPFSAGSNDSWQLFCHHFYAAFYWLSCQEMRLDVCIENLDEAQLNTSYRPEGWTVIQVIHHLADSHMNAYIRLKLSLTENNPTVKPYDEKLWAELPDNKLVPVNEFN